MLYFLLNMDAKTFVGSKHSQPSLIASKAVAHICWTWLEKLANDKSSGLFGFFVSKKVKTVF
jgi:hypothetical protein